MDTIEVGQDKVKVSVTPADEVILFTTIDGVELVNPANDFSERDCDTPDGKKTKSLAQLLQGFMNLGGEAVACPLCAMSRGITEPSYGIMGNGVDIHNLFLYGDKVIDF
jgi:sulfur relay (sulfurtransferase) complex TusBCD TusD component (DsrE family)